MGNRPIWYAFWAREMFGLPMIIPVAKDVEVDEELKTLVG